MKSKFQKFDFLRDRQILNNEILWMSFRSVNLFTILVYFTAICCDKISFELVDNPRLSAGTR